MQTTAPILRDLLAWLPPLSDQRVVVIALIVAGAGLFFWLIGSRFSRSIFTLVGVAVGTLIGLRLPRWFGWEVDAMAFAIGGALVLGLAGYLLQGMWVGTILGLLFAIMGAGVAWHRVGLGDATIPTTISVDAIWISFLGKLPRTIPATALVCQSAGGLIAWMWPKLGRVLAFSILGSFMLVGGGIVAAAIAKPALLERLPASAQQQGIALAVLMVVGVGIQWMLLPRARKASVSVAEDDGEEVKLNLKEARA